MNDDLFRFILQTQQVEYAKFSHDLRLEEHSPGLAAFLTTEHRVEPGISIEEVFIELVGYERDLLGIRDDARPPLELDWISQIPLSQPHQTSGNHVAVSYFNLQIYPFKSGLLAVLRDLSRSSDIEQIVYNRANELDILTKKLIEDLRWANAELQEAYKTTLEGWARALEMRDVETKGHSERVVILTRMLARALDVDEADIEFLCYGALLHDVGKMGIPDRILLKPGSLDDAELSIMRQHTRFAENLLNPIKYLEKALSIPAFHHEKWQGGGYPYGLRGEEIPLPARIFSVVDVFDALISDRPYHTAISEADALRYIADRAGTDFDPRVVEKFLALYSQAEPSDLP